MKVLNIELPKELKQIELFPLADFHIGDACADFQHIKDTLDYIKDTPNAYCILGGDMMDTAIASSIGDTYGSNLQPMEQLKMCVKLFEPIKDKILCVMHGNHENRVYKSDGYDMAAIMCDQLEIADKYTPTTALMFLRFGEFDGHGRHKQKICYTIYGTHGSGGGRREGGKINRLIDLATIVDADIYICGHTHLPAVVKESFFRISYQNSSVSVVEKTFVNTSAALDYGGYGDVQGYKPSSKEIPVIYLDGRRKKVRVRL